MKKALLTLFLFDVLFIVLLALSGSLGGAISELVYYAAPILPVGIYFLMLRRGRIDAQPLKLSVDGKGICIALLFAAPLILFVFLISGVTAELISLFGIEVYEPLSGSLPYLIVIHALIPAFLEEALFRYVPIALLAPYSRRGAVVISAILFSFAHCNLYQIPYAFFAGIAFAAVDIASGSIIPSVALHFLNNLISVLWQSGAIGEGRAAHFYILIAILSAISAAIFFFSPKLKARVTAAFSAGEPVGIPCEVVLFALFCASISILSLF